MYNKSRLSLEEYYCRIGRKRQRRGRNTNTNNLSGRRISESSDWEEFSIDDNEIPSEIINIAPGKCLSKVDIMESKNRLKIIKDNDGNEPDPDIKGSVNEYNERSFLNSHTYNNKMDTNGYRTEVCRILYILIQKVFLIIGILVNFPYAIFPKINCILKRTVYILSWILLTSTYRRQNEPIRSIQFRPYILFKIHSAYTKPSSMYQIPRHIMLFIIYNVLTIVHKYRYRFFQKKKGKKCVNYNKYRKFDHCGTNNNSAVEQCGTDNFPLCRCVTLVVFVVCGWLSLCLVYPESRVCSVDTGLMKMRIMNIGHEIYLLPGEDCMTSGRCCKGVMEATFRWTTCLFTLPIRAILTEWPISTRKMEGTGISIEGMKLSVDKILQKLTNAIAKTKSQEEFVVKLNYRLKCLEKMVKEKSNDIFLMEPILENLAKIMDLITTNINAATKQVKNVFSVHQDSDKLNENMKRNVRDTSSTTKTSITEFQTSVDYAHRELEAKIEILDNLIRDDQNKAAESTDRMLYKVKTELDQVKLAQDDIRGRLVSLRNLPEKYRKISDNVKKEVKAKLTDDLRRHGQMLIDTEWFCSRRMDQFRENFEKLKSDYKCFMENVVYERSQKIQKDLQKEISETFYDKTVEIAKRTAEEGLETHFKDDTSRGTLMRAAGFLREKMKEKIVAEDCSHNEAQLLNFSSFCEGFRKAIMEDYECLSNSQIRELVKSSVALYSADKIGLADFALESMGGSVITSRSSSTYTAHKGFFSFLSDPLVKITNSLRTIIQPTNQPGDCWPFEGSVGHAVIKLAHEIMVNAVTLEHLSASLSTEGGITSAPKKFTITKLPEKDQENEELIGSFEYKEDGSHIQTFHVQNPRPAKTIQMNILSNHGKKEYTCIYRLRIHGSVLERTASNK